MLRVAIEDDRGLHANHARVKIEMLRDQILQPLHIANRGVDKWILELTERP